MSEISLYKDPRFDALRNALYHASRRDFLDRLNKTMNSLVIILGAGVMGKVSEIIHVLPIWTEFAVVIVATVQLVFDFSASVKRHEFLQFRYYQLLAKIERDLAGPTQDDLEWSAELIAIGADGVTRMRAASAVAYNKALDAITADPEKQRTYRQIISTFQYAFRNVLPFHSVNFQPQTVGEAESQASRNPGPSA